MTQKEILLGQLEACQDKNHWFVAMSGALKGLTAEQAAAASKNGAHSVREILYHVMYWNERYLQRFNGREPPEPKNNDATFSAGGAGQSEAEWRALVERFDSAMNGWKKTIREADEAALAAPIRKDSAASWHSALADMMIHTAYHIGQIVTLRKLQGTWDSAQGVN